MVVDIRPRLATIIFATIVLWCHSSS